MKKYQEISHYIKFKARNGDGEVISIVEDVDKAKFIYDSLEEIPPFGPDKIMVENNRMWKVIKQDGLTILAKTLK